MYIGGLTLSIFLVMKTSTSHYKIEILPTHFTLRNTHSHKIQFVYLQTNFNSIKNINKNYFHIPQYCVRGRGWKLAATWVWPHVLSPWQCTLASSSLCLAGPHPHVSLVALPLYSCVRLLPHGLMECLSIGPRNRKI